MSTLEDLGMDPLLPPEEPHPCDDCGRIECVCDVEATCQEILRRANAVSAPWLYLADRDEPL